MDPYDTCRQHSEDLWRRQVSYSDRHSIDEQQSLDVADRQHHEDAWRRRLRENSEQLVRREPERGRGRLSYVLAPR